MKNTIQPTYECDLYSLELDEDGFLIAISKTNERTVEKQQQCFRLVKEICDHQKVCLLVDMRSSDLVTYNADIKEFYSREIPETFKAIAIVAESTIQKVGPTIFINATHPNIPVELFDNEQEAREWLRQYL